MKGDLTSDPAAENLAARPPVEAELATVDARTGGRPDRAPVSLSAAELEPDDEAVASLGLEDWDDPATL